MNEEKEAVVMLNSGGFDSVLMAHMVKEDNPNAIIYSLAFDYGQRNAEYELACARKVAEKLDLVHIELKIPMFFSEYNVHIAKVEGYSSECPFYYSDDYIPMRNMVFLSYALSLAQSRKAGKVYIAVIKMDEPYLDASLEFLDYVNSVAYMAGIQIHCPLVTEYKGEQLEEIKKYNITQDDFFSCNHPTNEGKPCGKCPDCLAIKYIYENLANSCRQKENKKV